MNKQYLKKVKTVKVYLTKDTRRYNVFTIPRTVTKEVKMHFEIAKNDQVVLDLHASFFKKDSH